MKKWSQGVGNNLKLMGQFFMRMLFYFTVIITGAFLVYRSLKAIQPSLEKGFSMMRDAFNYLSVIACLLVSLLSF